MIYNLLNIFKRAYDIKGDDLIISSYKLKEGIYIKINEQGIIIGKPVVIWKKEDQAQNQTPEYKWFRAMDFYSNWLYSHKSVKNKKIHSNNIYSVFIKKDTLIGKDSIDTDEVMSFIDEYIDTLQDKKYLDKEVLKTLKYELDEGEFEKSKEAFRNFFVNEFAAVEEKKDDFNNYIRVFVDKDIKSYKKEGERYFYHKIFNNNNFNEIIDNNLMGLSDMNMGLNSKKPYLEHKTTRFKVPFRILLGDALLMYKYSLWMKSQGYGVKYKPFNYDFSTELLADYSTQEVPDSIMINASNNNDQLEIQDFDIVLAHNKNIDFEIKNLLNAKTKVNDMYVKVSYSEFNNRQMSSFAKAINIFLYDKQLLQNWTRDSKDIKPSKFIDKILINNILMTREGVYNFIYKKDYLAMKNIVRKSFRDLMKEMVKKNYRKGTDAFNTYVACLKTFDLGGDILSSKLKTISTQVRELLLKSDHSDFQNSDEYAFTAGQVAYYLMNQSQAAKLKHDQIESFLSKNNVKDLNNEIKYWFKKYGHALNFNFTLFNSAIAKIMGYDSDEKYSEDIFLAGYLSSNLFYEKKQEDKKNEETK